MRELEAELCREIAIVLEDWQAHCEAKLAKELKTENRVDFRIEKLSPKGEVERVLATAGSIPIARAAFDEAVRCYSQARVTLRHGSQIIQKHDPKGGAHVQ
jgi:hypothetical protein